MSGRDHGGNPRADAIRVALRGKDRLYGIEEFVVATAAPRERAMAAIWASASAIGRPARRCVAAMSTYSRVAAIHHVRRRSRPLPSDSSSYRGRSFEIGRLAHRTAWRQGEIDTAQRFEPPTHRVNQIPS